ncbi:hypothetical protein FUMI01_25720 [Flavobacterium sp. UMI-01]|nr:hypothetical protein FUMI01_25720 [Flavobacterium sp. UMI-01]
MALACQKSETDLQELFSFPNKLKEVSGIVVLNDAPDLIGCVEDSGNKNKIYLLAPNGTIQRSMELKGIKNKDWEDLTQDVQGNLYVGDFGNNDNIRRDLVIYKLDKKELLNTQVTPAAIHFSYPEQKDFPPKKKNRYFDVEGFVVFQNHFYLFTKNRSTNFDGTAYIYKVPNVSGNHQAKKVGEFTTGSDYDHYAITSVALSPDQTKIAILTHSKIILFQNFRGDNFLTGKRTEIDLKHFSQKEAICFKDNETLYIADEKVKSSGGKLYVFKIQIPNQN